MASVDTIVPFQGKEVKGLYRWVAITGAWRTGSLSIQKEELVSDMVSSRGPQSLDLYCIYRGFPSSHTNTCTLPLIRSGLDSHRGTNPTVNCVQEL